MPAGCAGMRSGKAPGEYAAVPQKTPGFLGENMIHFQKKGEGNMKSLFQTDGLLFRALSWLTELMALNLCFLIGCLPVFTIGVSITALYASLFFREEGGSLRRFFREFRRNFRQGLLLGLLLGALGLLLLLDGRFLGQLGEGYAVFRYLLYLAGLIWLGVGCYAFGLTARYENTVVRTLKNALLLSISMLPRTVLMVLIDLAPLLMLLVSPELFGRSLMLWLLVGFAACAYAKVWVLRSVFSALPGGEKET